MFTSCYKAVFTCLFCVTTAFSVFADSPRAAYEQARQEALCAWMAMASYGDRPGLAARQELVRRGWHIDSQVQKDDKSEAKFHLARKGDDTLLAVTGTASLADIKSDLNLHSVAYGGTAGKTARKDGVRRVHAGFDHYTTTLLAAPYGGQTVGQVLAADAHAPKRLTLTGHSLGGAVAVLAAARLADQGASHLQVVTFGAPAVGNDAFNEAYGRRIRLDRIVMEGDPVEKAVQAVSRTYEQFPDKTVWQAAPTTRRFAHDIAGYADAALRRYYDAKTAYETYLGHAVPDDGGRPFGSPVWVPPLSLTLDEALQADTPYLERAADDQLGYRLHPVFARREQSLGEALRQARQHGCSEVLLRHFQARRLKGKEYDFALTYDEIWYDARTGLVRTAVSRTTDTGKMTSIEALLALAGAD